MRNKPRFFPWILILAAAAALAGPALGGADQDLDLFFKAKESVFKHEWKEAQGRLESYLKEYPRGRMRDEALYWLADCLHRLAGEEKGQAAVVEREKAALARLDDVLRSHPQSMWKDDALTLRAEIAASLVLLGESAYSRLIDEVVRTQNKDAGYIKIGALNSLAELDASIALPILRRTLREDPDSSVRGRCLALLIRFPAEEALPLLDDAAAKDKSDAVRLAAKKTADQVRQQAVPVRLRYFVYGARFLDESRYSEFPDNDVREITLERSAEGDAGALLDKARRAIGGKISSPASSANGTMPLPPTFGPSSRIMNRAGDFLIWINSQAVILRADCISGEVEFRSRKTNEAFTRSIRVDPSKDKLLVARSGSNLALLLFQFAGETAEEKESGAAKGKSDSTGYGPLDIHSRIALTHGIKVHTEKADYALGDFETNLIDLNQAKAEIPARGERPFLTPRGAPWRLIGDLFFLRDKDVLIGFGSTLLNPDREVVAEGLIQVPAGDPAGFKLLDGRSFEKNRKIVAAEDEERTRPIYPTQISNEWGWTIFTTRGSWGQAETGGRKTDYGLSRATRSHDGRDWVLIGQIISLLDQRTFIARQAALIVSDGTILQGSEIRVPADNPAGSIVVQK